MISPGKIIFKIILTVFDVFFIVLFFIITLLLIREASDIISTSQTEPVYGNLYVRGHRFSRLSPIADFIFNGEKIGTVTDDNKWSIRFPYMYGNFTIDQNDLMRILNSELNIKYDEETHLTGNHFFIYNCKSESIILFSQYNKFKKAATQRGINIKFPIKDSIMAVLDDTRANYDQRDFTPTCQYVVQ